MANISIYTCTEDFSCKEGSFKRGEIYNDFPKSKEAHFSDGDIREQMKKEDEAKAEQKKIAEKRKNKVKK